MGTQKFYANLITPLSKLKLKKLNEIMELGYSNKLKRYVLWSNLNEIFKSILTSKGIDIGDLQIKEESYPSIGEIIIYLKILFIQQNWY